MVYHWSLKQSVDQVDLPSPAMVNILIKPWAKAAGINKRFTFHTARHTFATMMLTLGADLYTTSKLLGHADVKMTDGIVHDQRIHLSIAT